MNTRQNVKNLDEYPKLYNRNKQNDVFHFKAQLKYLYNWFSMGLYYIGVIGMMCWSYLIY